MLITYVESRHTKEFSEFDHTELKPTPAEKMLAVSGQSVQYCSVRGGYWSHLRAGQNGNTRNIEFSMPRTSFWSRGCPLVSDSPQNWLDLK